MRLYLLYSGICDHDVPRCFIERITLFTLNRVRSHRLFGIGPDEDYGLATPRTLNKYGSTPTKL